MLDLTKYNQGALILYNLTKMKYKDQKVFLKK